MKDPVLALARLREAAKRGHLHLPLPPFNVCPECSEIDADYEAIMMANWSAPQVGVSVKLSVVPPAGGEEVTHICNAGQVVCGAVSGPPSSWPRGHFRVGPGDAEKATCPRCLDLFLARNYGT